MKNQPLSARVSLPAQAVLGESPVWDSARDILWWVDIARSRLHSFDPRSNANETLELSLPVTSVVTTDSGDLLIACPDRIAILAPEVAQLQSLALVNQSSANSRLNDGKCDPNGRYWIGSISLAATPEATEALYVFDCRSGLRRILSGVTASNGMAWSADGRTMYYIDSWLKTVDAFDYDLEAGIIGNRRVVFEVPQTIGIADGMTIDSDGLLWVAFWGGGCVARIDPAAHAIERQVLLPVTNVTSCTFGGTSLDQLYITTARHGLSPRDLAEQPHAGSLFVADVDVVGLPPAAFCHGSDSRLEASEHISRA